MVGLKSDMWLLRVSERVKKEEILDLANDSEAGKDFSWFSGSFF